MFNSVISIAITLVFMFLLLAVMVTAVNELIFTFTRSRSKQLEQFLAELFFDDIHWKEIFEKVKNSPFINVLKKAPHRFPSHIPSENFTSALMAHLGNNNMTIEALKKAVEERKNSGSEFIAMLEAQLSVNPSIEELRVEFDKMFNNAMDRLSGWYKRKAKIMSFVFALAICLVLNVDTLSITNNLWHNKDKADQIASFAVAASKYFEKNDSSQVVMVSGTDTLVNLSTGNKALTDSKLGKAVSSIDTTGNKVPQQQLVKSYSMLSAIDLPMGWSKENYPSTSGSTGRILFEWFLKLLGILLTTAAVSLGAPYWFDILNKITPLKQTSSSGGTAQGKPAADNSANPGK